MRIEGYSPCWQKQVSTLADRVLGTGFFESPAQIERDAKAVAGLGGNSEVTSQPLLCS